MQSLLFAKHFVPLHRRLCLTLVKIAKLKLRVYMEAQTAVHILGLPICAYRRVFGDTLRGVADGAVHFRCIVLTRKNIAL